MLKKRLEKKGKEPVRNKKDEYYHELNWQTVRIRDFRFLWLKVLKKFKLFVLNKLNKIKT
jgi:hypothetical protein